MSFGPRSRPSNKGAYGLVLSETASKFPGGGKPAAKTPQTSVRSKVETPQQASPKPAKIQSAAAPKDTDSVQRQEEPAAPVESSIDEETAVVPKVHHLIEQSSRWLNLSSCLWCLIVMDAPRDVDKESITSFMQMLEWRINGNISEEEFAVLYSEWSTQPSHQSAASLKASTSKSVSMFGIRNLFLTLDCVQESKLDLYIALISYETNRVLLNNPISYKPTGNGVGGSSKPSLETCSRPWLELAEELFFLLDSHGGGLLKFDDFYFLCACCTIGLNVWTVTDCQLVEEEVEQDISAVTLSALAVQFMRDAGSKASLSIYDRAALTAAVSEGNSDAGGEETPVPVPASLARKDSAASASGAASKRRQSGGGAFGWTNSAGIPSSATGAAASLSNANVNKANSHLALLSQNINNARSMVVTLPMFKGLLLRRGIGEALLKSLVKHVRETVAQLYSIALDNDAEDLAQAMQFKTTDGIVVGSPKLWSRSVSLATGDSEAAPTGALHEPDPEDVEYPPDPLKLFLEVDADRQIGGVFYAANADLAHLSVSEATESVRLHERLIYPLSQKLLCSYKIWSGLMGLSKESMASLQNFPHQVDTRQLETLQKEPVFMLILSTLIEYKTLQNQFTAALFDLVMTTHEASAETLASPSAHKGAPATDGLLSRVCAMLLHPAPDVHKELDGLVSDIYVTHTRKHHEEFGFASALFNSTHPHQHHPGATPMSAQVTNPSNAGTLKREVSHGSYGSLHGADGPGHPHSGGHHSPAVPVRQSSVTFETLKIADTSNAQWKAVFDDVTPAESPNPVSVPVEPPKNNHKEGKSSSGKETKHATAAAPPPSVESAGAESAAAAPPPSVDAALEAMLIDRLLSASDDGERERVLSALRMLRGKGDSSSSAGGTAEPTPAPATGVETELPRDEAYSPVSNTVMRNHSERSGFSRTLKAPVVSNSTPGTKLTLENMRDSPDMNPESPLTIGSESEASTSATSVRTETQEQFS